MVRGLSSGTEDSFPSLAAGVMPAASVFALLLLFVEFGQIQFGEPISAVLVAAEGELSESVGVLLLDTGTGDDAGITGPRRTVFSGNSRALLP